MRAKHTHLLAFMALVVLLLGPVALAAGQTAIPWDVLAGGGDTVGSGAVTISDTIGQTVTGAAQGGDVVIGSGFWYGVPASPPPAATNTPTATPTPPPTDTATPTPTAVPPARLYFPLLLR